MARRLGSAMIFCGWALATAACNGGPSRGSGDSATGTSSPLINGAPVASSVPGGQVLIVSTSGKGTSGSGILLTNEWVLTAAHVVDQDLTSPQNLIVTLGLNLETHAGAQVRVHPLWGFNPSLDFDLDPSIIDMALVRVSPPFTGPYARNISDLDTPPIVDGPNVRVHCFGYGKTTASSPGPTVFAGQITSIGPGLHDAIFDPQIFPLGVRPTDRWNTAFTVLATVPTDPIIASGDSGGACLAQTPAGAEDVLGIMVSDYSRSCSDDTQCGFGAGDVCLKTKPTDVLGFCVANKAANVQAAQSFRGFARAAMRAGASGTVDVNGTSGTLTLRTDPATNKLILEFDVLGINLGPFDTGLQDISNGTGIAQMELRDVDGDGLDDLMLLAEGMNPFTNTFQTAGVLINSRNFGDVATALSNFAASGLSLLQAFPWDIPANVQFMRISFVDPDQFPDVVVTGADARSVSYFGSQNGVVRDYAPRGFDFDGDGREDIGIWGPHEFGILFGTNNLAIPSIKHSELAGDNDRVFNDFAWGDFDGSCRGEGTCAHELVIADRFRHADAGSVYYLSFGGTERELRADAMLDDPALRVRYGSSVAAGDFDGDGFDDLAVASWSETSAHPSVQIVYGNEGGLDTGNVKRTITPDMVGMAAGDWALLGLKTGDFNCDGTEDLAIGAPLALAGGVDGAGAVLVINGQTDRAAALNFYRIDKTQDGMVGDPATSDHFGFALAAGNFNSDRGANGLACVDLAVGGPTPDETGEVYIVLGGASGLSGAGSQHLQRGLQGIPDTTHPGDSFGSSLAVFRANTDTFDDLIVGSLADSANAGAVFVLLGSAEGIASSGHFLFRPNDGTVPLPLGVENHGRFGQAVGGASQLVVGVQSDAEDLISISEPPGSTNIVGGAGLLQLLQLSPNEPTGVVQIVDALENLKPGVASLSEEFLQAKAPTQSWTDFLSQPDLDTFPTSKLVPNGVFGMPTQARPGFVNGRQYPPSNLARTWAKFTSGPGALIRVPKTPPVLPPAARCHDVTLAAGATCSATVSATAVDNGSSDPQGLPLFVSIDASGPLSLGVTTVKLTASNGQLSSSCTAQVRVNDVTPPSVSLPPDVTLGRCLATGNVTVGRATATDNCAPQPVVTGQVVTANGVPLQPPINVAGNQAALGLGTYTVRWSASDGANTAQRTQTVFVGAKIQASQSIVVGDQARVATATGVGAGMMSSGSGETRLGNDALSGGILSVGPVSVLDRSHVDGGIVTHGQAVVSPSATVTGVVTRFAQVSVPALPTLPAFPAPTGGDVVANPGAAVNLAPRSYRSLTVNSGATVALAAGDYFFGNLIVNAAAHVRATATTRVFVAGQLVFRSPFTTASGNVQAISLGFAGSAATLEAPYNGSLLAPSAHVSFGSGSGLTFVGTFAAATLDVRPASVLSCQ